MLQDTVNMVIFAWRKFHENFDKTVHVSRYQYHFISLSLVFYLSDLFYAPGLKGLFVRLSVILSRLQTMCNI